MSNISKQELISNLKDKISQFKSNFTKNKETRKDIPDLNFEINRDALKLFYKNKSEVYTEGEKKEQHQNNQKEKLDEIYDIKNILNNNNKPKSSSNNNLIKIEKNAEKKINNNNNEQDNKNYGVGAINKNNCTFENKETNNNEDLNHSEKNNSSIYQINKQNEENKENKDLTQKNNNININTKINYINKNNNNYDNNKNNKFNFEYENYTKFNPKNNNIKDNSSLGYIALNNSNYHDFNIDNIMNSKKLDKREKSAPKISINQNKNTLYIEKPLTDKHNQNELNLNNINFTSNYNTNINNEFNPKKTNKTEELYQKLLVNFNINSKNNKKNISFYNFNSKTNINNKYNKENNQNHNKSYGQINIKDINLLYEINGNGNCNNYNQKKNYFRNELNLDHLKDLYNKKTEDVQRPTQSGLKSKMDLFYQELNQYKNANNYKKQTLNNYFSNDKNLNNKIASNTQYNNYMRNTNNNNININYQKNFEINKNSSYNWNNITYNEIHAFKQYLKNISKEDINNLPYNMKSELIDIFNILYQKFND